MYIRDSIFKGMFLFYYFVFYYLLIIGGIEINLGFELNFNIRFIYNNVCSILLKFDIIFNELSEYDIIVIIESYLDELVVDIDIELDGF